MNFFRDTFMQSLSNSGISEEEKEKVWNNYKKSVNQAAYVLWNFKEKCF